MREKCHTHRALLVAVGDCPLIQAIVLCSWPGHSFLTALPTLALVPQMNHSPWGSHSAVLGGQWYKM